MRVYLAGHEGTKPLIPAASYLASKCLQPPFVITFLNYGRIVCGNMVSLKPAQGSVSDWGPNLASYLECVEPTDYIIFGLDDYLLAGPIINRYIFLNLLELLDAEPSRVCARLGESSCFDGFNRESLGGFFFQVSGVPYTVTTQYSIWRLQYLGGLLKRCSTPWDFEISGSRMQAADGMSTIASTRPALHYDGRGALSLSRWPGKVRVDGLSWQTVDELVEGGLLPPKPFLLHDCVTDEYCNLCCRGIPTS